VRYLITSGNSKIGLEVLKALRALGETDVVVGTRNVEKSKAELTAAGGRDVIQIDLYDVASIKAAMKDVERALLVAGNPTGGSNDYIQWAKNFVEAAKASPSLKLIARMSGAGSNPNGEDDVERIQGLSDQELKMSGIPYFTVGPSFFFTNFFGQKKGIQYGQVIGAAGEGRTCYIAAEDIGAVAAVLLRNPEKHELGKNYVITGPEAITDAEVVAAIGEVLGKSVSYNNLTPEAFTERMKGYGIPPRVAEFMTSLEVYRLNNHAAKKTNVVEELTGRKPMSAKEWANIHKNAFV